MANKSLFQSSVVGRLLPATDSRNQAQVPAYAFTAKHALAQYAATGCMNQTFYAGAEEQLQTILELSEQVDSKFIAQTAIYCREKGNMKDTPALLCALLSVKAPELLPATFQRVIDNGKMLRNFVQIMRSGATGRKSLGSMPKRLVTQWLNEQNDHQLFCSSIGQSPSMADVIKMVHPKPQTQSRDALYAYLLGNSYVWEDLPETIQHFEAYKAKQSERVPRVPFQFLTSLNLGKAEWVEIAKNASWQMTRMNLNTFARHGVFEVEGMNEMIAQRLGNAEEIRKARVFPYQLMVAYCSAGQQVSREIREALQDALEIAIENVPSFEGKTYVCPDVSGSMAFHSVTGNRSGATSVVRCIHVAALMVAAVLRKNPDSEVLPFEHGVVPLDLNPRDSVMSNAQKLASIGGGGTNCSAPLALLNRRKAKGNLVIFVSDNQSWMDARSGRGTQMMQEWQCFKERNPNARLVCIDIQPGGTTQASEQSDIMNIGGFSDQVFSVLAAFAEETLGPEHWIGKIEEVSLN